MRAPGSAVGQIRPITKPRISKSLRFTLGADSRGRHRFISAKRESTASSSGFAT